jgi:hypothetical protein
MLTECVEREKQQYSPDVAKAELSRKIDDLPSVAVHCAESGFG